MQCHESSQLPSSEETSTPRDGPHITGDKPVANVLDAIRALGLASRMRTGSRRAVQEQTVKDHHKIVAALRARDPEAASAAMHRHLENVERA